MEREMYRASGASYQPLARRFRPVRFEGENGLVGQPHVAQTLKNAIRERRIANAYLLSGPRGTGKTTAARLLAASLNCLARTSDHEPCGKCDNCGRILGGQEAYDVVEIDAASNRGVDDARNLRQNAYYSPSTEHGYRVFIIDEAHMLTKEAWNVLLKVLEEPPPRVLFVFCTTEPQRIEQAAQPILSRCQRLEMRRITQADIATHLGYIAEQEGISIQDGARHMLARRADGGLRDALSMLDQLRAFQGDEGMIDEAAVRDAFGIQPESVYLGAIDIIAEQDRIRVFRLVDHLDAQGADFVSFIAEFYDTLLALLYAQEGGIPVGWSENGLAGIMKRAGYTSRNGAWVRQGEPKISAESLVELMLLTQERMILVRQSPRPGTILLMLLQQAISHIGGVA